MHRIMPDHGGAGDGYPAPVWQVHPALVIPRWLASDYDLL